MTTSVKTILVTGGARRVGRHIAEHLARAGYGVVIHANTSASEAAELAQRLRMINPHVFALAGDLSDAGAARGLADEAAALAGAPLCGLVNSASVFEYDRPGACDAGSFDRAMAVNLRAPVLIAERFAALADRTRDNCIVNVLDQKLWNMNPDFYSYTMSKAGLLAATDMMARAFAPYVRVNAIAPGLLLPSHDQTQAEFEAAASLNLLGRPISLDEVAGAIVFLLTSRALTGQIIHVDNGQRLGVSARDVMFEVRERQ